MAAAMGRSLLSILFGAFRPSTAVAAGSSGEDRPVRSGSPQDVAILLGYARKVVIVPGYGLAVAQAQHTIRELAELLEARGVEVIYGIHPVAGRMPGHMNVLLAEANVPYEVLKEMDEVNPEFSTDRRRAGRRRQRRGQPGGQDHPGRADLRHADPRGRPGGPGRLPQALDAARASPASTTSCSSTPRPPCSSATPRTPSPRWSAR